jgi:hypothetical protein
MTFDFQNLPPRAIVIHGGQHKTGSSAIQNTLAGQREQLAEQGWLYPQSGCIVQEATGHRHFKLMAEARKGQDFRSWRQLRKEVQEWPGRVLLSHEGFFSPHIDPQCLREQLPADREVYLLAYLRHPADYVESCYREWVRRWKFTGSLRDHYEQRQGYLDVGGLATAWEETFGAGHIRLRPYDRGHFDGGSVLTDFLAQLGLDAGLAAFPASGNDSLNSAQVMVYLVANQLRASPAKRDALADLLADAQAASTGFGAWDGDDAVQSSPEPQKLATLQYVLNTAAASHRIMDDTLLSEIEERYLGAYRRTLIAHGARREPLKDSSYARLPHDTRLFDPTLRSAIESLIS